MGKNRIKKGQIGKITVTKPINLWQRDANNKLKFVRVLKQGEEYRVYRYDNLHGGQYGLGGGMYITKMPTHIKYETPSKAKLAQLFAIDGEFAALAKQGKLSTVPGNIGMTFGSLKKMTTGTTGQSEALLFYATQNAVYGFSYAYVSGRSYDRIYSDQKVALIYRDVSTNETEQEIAKQLQTYFGKPVVKDTYKAGNYYVTFERNEQGKVSFFIGTKDSMNSLRPDDGYDNPYQIK